MGKTKEELRSSVLTKNHYFKWLVDCINYDRNYRLLLLKLHNKRFYWTVDRDKNRAEDGMALRNEFYDIANLSMDEYVYIYKGPCTVLEMLVGLSKRIDLEIRPDFENGECAYKWFWLMISNLGLDIYDNDHFDEYEIDRKLDYFLERGYGKDGKGSLFPLKKGSNFKHESAKKMEIWFQMQCYLLENNEF